MHVYIKNVYIFIQHNLDKETSTPQKSEADELSGERPHLFGIVFTSKLIKVFRNK